VNLRLRQVFASVIAALPAVASGQASGPPAPDPAATRPEAATVHVVVPERPYLRRRSAHLSDELRTPDDRSKPWLEWEDATGDWGGLRPKLHERGIIPEIEFTGQLFSSVRGGLTRSDTTHAAELTSLSLTFDTARLGLWRGGTALLSVEHHDGRGVSREVGSLDEIGTLDQSERSFTRFATYTIQQSFYDDRLVARFGKADSNDGFVDSDLTGLFLNGGISPPPNLPMPTYPETSLGLALFADPTPWLTLASGSYGADLGIHEHGGAGLFRGRVFAIAELTLHASHFGLPGHYNAGAWLRTVDTPDPGKAPGGRSFDRNYGAYVLLDQQLTAESPTQQDQGLGFWFQLSWAPPDRNENDLWVGGGFVYTGLIPGRDDDQLGLGASGAYLTPGPGASGSPAPEFTFECFYALQLAPWLTLQPDLQIVIDPAGGGRDAVVLGAQLSIEL
jgi:porin